MAGLSVIVKTGNITDQRADAIVNSANTFLLMGSGTAGQIRDAGGNIAQGSGEYEAYFALVAESRGILKEVLKHVHRQRPQPSIIQGECLRLVISSNASAEIPIGCAVATSSGNLYSNEGTAKHIIHAIAMSYDWKVQPNPPIIAATDDSVRMSLTNSFEVANEIGCDSVAVPVMCTRKGGLSREASVEATLRALETLNRRDSKVKEVAIVLYNEELAKDASWFRSAFRNK
jgi:O-acetyl-ADP-ribose deacetylase (regulator of RNase III)